MDYISLAQALCGLHTPIFFGPVNMRHWPISGPIARGFSRPVYLANSNLVEIPHLQYTHF